MEKGTGQSARYKRYDIRRREQIPLIAEAGPYLIAGPDSTMIR